MTAREIVAAALNLDSAGRASYLEQACGEDHELRREVEVQLRAKIETAAIGPTESPAPGAGETQPDTFIGPYRLIRKLGEGGMGVVYQAAQLQPIHREVALKLIQPGMDSKQVIARFESERQALAMMDHPHIARVYDAGATSGGRPYFVMELVDGVPIGRYCDTERLTIQERVKLLIPVCQAIQHAHQKGIIHRDIKPSNILVARQDDMPAPKVIDFGLAKALGPALGENTMLTHLGTVMGTLRYMSPEQANVMHGDIDTRSDVYSLGAVLYELLTGVTPLDLHRASTGSYIEILQRIRDEEAAPPSARVRQSANAAELAACRRSDPARLPKLLKGELDWITMKALEKDRGRRYETANALARDLERYLEGEAVEAGPPSAAYRIRKYVRKHRLWLATAAAFLVLLVSAAVVSTIMALAARRAQQEARAVNDFLQSDLLAQASANRQARPGERPDPDLKVRTALDRAAERIEGKFASQPLVEASIRQTIGDTYRDLGLYPEAQRQVERALELRRRALGEKNADTLSALDDLVGLYRLQGKYAQAEPLNVALVDGRRRLSGERDAGTLNAMSNLASLYGYQNKYSQAQELFTKVIELQRSVLGEENPDTLSSMNNLATLYQRQGNYKQAAPLYEKTMEIERRVQGEDHPDTLVTMSGVAVAYRAEGRFAEAEALQSRVLEAQRRVLGEEHLYTLNTMNHLAGVYLDEGKNPASEELYSKALEIQRRVLGPEHPETLLTMTGLASVYRAQGKFPQAEQLYNRALEIQSRVLGPEARDVRNTLERLADLYRLERKFAMSEALYQKVLEMRRRLAGNQHPDTLATMLSLAVLCQEEGKRAEAEALAREALDGYLKIDADAWERYNAESLLGMRSGYEGLKQREARIPAVYRWRIAAARR